MLDPKLLPAGYEVTEEDLRQTPPRVIRLLVYLLTRIQILEEENAQLKKRVKVLEARLNQNSANSSKPPSSDRPYAKKPEKKEKAKAGAKKGHKGHRQKMLEPTMTQILQPAACPCGNTHFPETHPYYTHQVIELPEIIMEVTHVVLKRGHCPVCGKMNKALLLPEQRSGFGPRLSAMIVEIAGNHGDSRTIAQNFCQSVLGVHISLGAIQKIIDRVTQAIEPHYVVIAQEARNAPVNNIDETSHRQKGKLSWLWVMANSLVVFFMIHGRRSGEAFKSLIEEWNGILISDGDGIYQKYIGLRQTCLAHLIRHARVLAERKDKELAWFGKRARSELQRLCYMAKAPPTRGEWQMFYARFIHLISSNLDKDDERGKFARRLARELECLWTFLSEQGVSPTNNHAERALRFAVIWRKRSFGTQSEKGDVLVEAISSYFKGTAPDITWISRA